MIKEYAKWPKQPCDKKTPMTKSRTLDIVNSMSPKYKTFYKFLLKTGMRLDKEALGVEAKSQAPIYLPLFMLRMKHRIYIFIPMAIVIVSLVASTQVNLVGNSEDSILRIGRMPCLETLVCSGK